MSNKFKEFFSEPQFFNNHTYVLDGEIDQEEVARIFSEHLDEEVTIDQLEVEFVRYGYAPEFVEDCAGDLCWYSGAKEGKGSKKIWSIEA